MPTKLRPNFSDGSWNMTNYERAPLPFPLHIFGNFLPHDHYRLLRNDVKRLVLERKDNDLYKFKQSRDLSTEINPKQLPASLHEFITMLSDKLRSEITAQLNISLSQKFFDITISRYKQGEYLLCHNDHTQSKNEGYSRAIAWVYYLVPRKLETITDGGSLAVYKIDKNGWPTIRQNLINPEPNTIVMFETGPDSWHSVEEVTATGLARYSINGWFYSKSKKFSIEYPRNGYNDELESMDSIRSPIDMDDELGSFVQAAINPEYLNNQTCEQIRESFLQHEEICLDDFLNADVLHSISLELAKAKRNQSKLDWCGPYEKRSYSKFKLDRLSRDCQNLFRFFQTDFFFLFLKQITGLELEPEYLCDNESDKHAKAKPIPSKAKPKDGEPCCRLEWHSYKRGDYTMIQDYSYERKQRMALDVMMVFNHDSDVDRQNGGYYTYLKTDAAKDKSRPDANRDVLFIEPKSNTLNLVLRRDQGFSRFLKYMNMKHKEDFQVLNGTYFQCPEDISCLSQVSS